MKKMVPIQSVWLVDHLDIDTKNGYYPKFLSRNYRDSKAPNLELFIDQETNAVHVIDPDRGNAFVVPIYKAVALSADSYPDFLGVQSPGVEVKNEPVIIKKRGKPRRPKPINEGEVSAEKTI